jgi:ribosomal protein S6
VEASLGGKTMAYQIEKKTRMFIDEILKYTCAQFNSNGQRWVYFDMEVEMRLFQEVIRPDYQMMRKA